MQSRRSLDHKKQHMLTHRSAATSATSCLSPSALLVPVSLVEAVRRVSCTWNQS